MKPCCQPKGLEKENLELCTPKPVLHYTGSAQIELELRNSWHPNWHRVRESNLGHIGGRRVSHCTILLPKQTNTAPAKQTLFTGPQPQIPGAEAHVQATT